MNWSHRNNSLTTLVVVTVCVLLVYMYDVRSAGVVRHTVRTITIPLYDYVVTPLRNITFAGFFYRNSALVHENEVLKARLAEFETTSIAYTALKDAYTQLSSEARAPREHDVSISRIITRPTLSPYGTFLVTASPDQNITPGALVLVHSIAIAKIVDVHTAYAQAELLFSPNSELSASVRGIPLTLRGQGGANALADAPRGSELSVGDVVTAPELGWRAVGVISSVTDDSAQSHVRIIVRPATNLDAAEFVSIEQN